MGRRWRAKFMFSANSWLPRCGPDANPILFYNTNSKKVSLSYPKSHHFPAVLQMNNIHFCPYFQKPFLSFVAPRCPLLLMLLVTTSWLLTQLPKQEMACGRDTCIVLVWTGFTPVMTHFRVPSFGSAGRNNAGVSSTEEEPERRSVFLNQ